jgi:hypothetical protein
MSNAHDRRAPGTARIPFDAMVEVGGSLGPSFEAQAINLSEEGMSLRTAYLPEVGQPVMCRFDGGHGLMIVAAGEVLWNEDMGDGGEFGIRFTNLDGASTVSLQRILGMAEDGQPPEAVDPGRKVRLHIEGLASPMRARIKNQAASGITAYSELGFLQMGKPLELEDAASGNRRPALIDRVQVEMDQNSRIPQLVVSLRYDDQDARAPSLAAVEVPVDDAQEPSSQEEAAGEMEGTHARAESEDAQPAAEANVPAPEDANIAEESNKLKSAFARNAAKVTPALLAWAKRAKVTAALLAARARRGASGQDDVEIPMRRTTAPAPGGGLHTAGRKVVRGSMADDRIEEEPKSRFKIPKKKAAVGASIGIATILAFIALHKPAPAPQLASAPPADDSATPVATMPAATITSTAPPRAPVPPPNDPLTAAAAAMANDAPVVHGRPTPFKNGNVGSHPTIIKIKMDGPVEGIQGAAQPTGFTVVTPNRKVMDPTTSLASKDPRLENVRVANEPNGAEFTVSFKDGVPNYIVRAHGDTLELVLARASGHDKAEANASSGSKKKKSKKR